MEFGTENHNVRRWCYKNKNDMVLWKREKTILNVAWEREKHREREKVHPIASRLSDKAQLSKQSQLWGSEWEFS